MKTIKIKLNLKVQDDTTAEICHLAVFFFPLFLCVLEESKRDSVLMLSFNLCFNKTCMSARLAYLFVFQIAAVKLSIVFFCFHRDI